jgi:3D (Asp-Asp-Asp) domain-containing protein
MKNRNKKGQFAINHSKTTIAILLVAFIMFATAFFAKQAYGGTRKPIGAEVQSNIGSITSSTSICIKQREENDQLRVYCGSTPEALIWSIQLDAEENKPEVKSKSNKVTDKIKITLTGYSSRAQETDDTPCISADGSDICELHAKGETICASNDFPMHSIITIDGVGDCIIRDRMNKRYTGTNRVDLYYGYDTISAINHGLKSTYAVIKKNP